MGDPVDAILAEYRTAVADLTEGYADRLSTVLGDVSVTVLGDGRILEPGDPGYSRRIPSVPEPDMAEYMEATMYGDELSEAIDGCDGIEPDGICGHGAPSWERYWGVI